MSDLQTHLDPELVEMLNRLRLVPALPVSARHAGTHRSRLRGGPVEFAEHRHYSPGDDLRGVDWKLYGRTDRYFVRQNVDDSSLRCLILLDATGSMTFRSQAALAGKFEFARRLAAAIAWVVVNQQDEVGLIPFPDSTGHVITPRAGRGQLDVMSDALDQITPGGTSSFVDVLTHVCDAFRSPCVIVLISDLLNADDDLRTGLGLCAAQRHDLRLLQIVDPAEQEFPFEERTRFTGMETASEHIVEPSRIRDAYRSEFEALLDRIRASCLANRAQYTFARTDGPMDRILESILARRSRSGGSLLPAGAD